MTVTNGKPHTWTETVLAVTLEFVEPCLGTVALDPNLYERYILSKAEDPDECADELATLPSPEEAKELLERATTGFHCTEDGFGVYDYWIKGGIKSACAALWKTGESRISQIRAWRQAVNNFVHPEPRFIHFRYEGRLLAPNTELAVLERPLRASTPQGERVALARSFTVPPGTQLSFRIKLITKTITPAIIRECLDFSQYVGFGQWRTAGYGRARVIEFGVISE